MSRTRLTIVAAPALLLAMGCSSLQRPEIRSVRPHITAIDLQGVSLIFDVDVSNPYPFAMRAPKFDYAVDVEGNEFIKSQSPVEVDLPAHQGGTLTLPARFAYADLWRTFNSLKDSSEVKYQLRGTFMLAALGQSYDLPLSHSGTFPVLRLPKVSIGHVGVSEVSLTNAKVTAEATLHNPNIFALGMNNLGYAVQLGDVPVGSVTASTADTIAAGTTGKLTLAGQITAKAALLKLLQGSSLGEPAVSLAGTIQTPYGAVPIGGRE
jgi:LEA14-like dessication related protein